MPQAEPSGANSEEGANALVGETAMAKCATDLGQSAVATITRQETTKDRTTSAMQDATASVPR